MSRKISTHAPLAGRDCRHTAGTSLSILFQPTRPLRGATARHQARLFVGGISTPAPLAGRDSVVFGMGVKNDDFNPRAPCGARHYGLVRRYVFHHFNPRAPCGARHMDAKAAADSPSISTHAPLAGRDLVRTLSMCCIRYFNPRAPCGARRRARWYTIPKSVFQPTRPLRGATAKVYKSLCTFLR